MKHIVVHPSLGTATCAPPELARWLGTRAPRDTNLMPAVAALGMALLDANPDHIQLVDVDGNTLWMNKAACSRQGVGAAASGLEKDAASYSPRLAASALANAIADAARGGCPRFKTATREAGRRCWWDVRVIGIDGSEASAGQFLVIAQDVTAQHQADAAVAHATSHDLLTGLVRRELFHRRVEALIASGSPGFCVMVIDIDRFRELNETRGREVGDVVLRTVGARLARVVRRGEIAARLGGDEFGVILHASAGDVTGVVKARAQAILDGLAKTIRGAGQRPRISASAGLACFPADGDAAALLCRNAESVLLEAKGNGRGLIVQFDAELRQSQAFRAKMLAHADRALTERDILPYYQPKIDLRSGRVVGFEALLRWRSPSGTIEMPAGIWPAFTHPVLARRLTEAMLGRVIADLVRWQRRGLLLPVAINVSDSDLGQSDFAERLIERLAAAGLATSCIEVEVTEMSVLGRNADNLDATLRAIQAAGIRIALDDFGTGYASLTHLKKLPIDVIKIDRSFVSNLSRDRGDRAIVEGMLSMARNLAIEVVAEGIEHADEARFLRDRGCDLGQGFLFSKGVPASQVPALLSEPALPVLTALSDDSADIASAGSGGTW